MLRVITFKLDERTLELLDLYAKKHRISRSDAIRDAIWLLLKKNTRLYTEYDKPAEVMQIVR